MIWVVEWSQPGQSDSNITLWNTRDEARAAACADIMDDVINNWDLMDPDVRDQAQRISDECAALNFDVAIDMYNDWMSGEDFEAQQFYRVFDRSIQTTQPNIHLLSRACSGNVQTIPVAAPTPVAGPFKAIVAGATCRGPCGSFNEHAYADKADATYCCYQCKYMSQVFGGTTP